jgi:glycine betaine/choline ABC-type transport system substrate-binding protein
MRDLRRSALGATSMLLAAALALAACSSGGDGTTSTGGTGSVAGQLTLGGPPECPQRPFCIPGLKDTYGITFKSFRPLDVGGAQTVAALQSGAIQVALLFSTDPVITDNGWVALEDDKHLQNAELITPVVRSDVATDAVTGPLNAVSAKLTTENIVPLIKQVTADKMDVADVARGFLQEQGLLGTPTTGGAGTTLTVGVSAAFAENQIVAEMYAQVLENAGFTINRELDLASREVSDPALESGQIDIKPEYLASELAGPLADAPDKASGDPTAELEALRSALEPHGIVVLEPSQANDTNVFVVTKETADRYGLTTVSDLATSA